MKDYYRPCRYEDEKGNIYRVDPTAIKFTDDKFKENNNL